MEMSLPLPLATSGLTWSSFSTRTASASHAGVMPNAVASP